MRVINEIQHKFNLIVKKNCLLLTHLKQISSFICDQVKWKAVVLPFGCNTFWLCIQLDTTTVLKCKKNTLKCQEIHTKSVLSTTHKNHNIASKIALDIITFASFCSLKPENFVEFRPFERFYSLFKSCW